MSRINPVKKKYDIKMNVKHLERIKALLNKPIGPMPEDGVEWSPDFAPTDQIKDEVKTTHPIEVVIQIPLPDNIRSFGELRVYLNHTYNLQYHFNPTGEDAQCLFYADGKIAGIVGYFGNIDEETKIGVVVIRLLYVEGHEKEWKQLIDDANVVQEVRDHHQSI